MADYTYEDYITKDGDMVDAIAYARFGSSAVYTESILDANPGLAALDPVLPAGLTIRIPVPVKADRTLSTSLWT